MSSRLTPTLNSGILAMLWLDHTIAMMRVWLLLLNLFILCLPIMSLLRVYTYTLSLRSTRVLLARLHATSKLKSLGSKALVIVESPTKAKTIGAFLQSNEKYQNYIIDSCAGHIREISSELKDNRVVDANLNIKISDLGIDVFKSFKPEYRVMPQKREVIQRLKDHCKGASEILLATDEDREGEAISAHLVDVLKPSIPYKVT
ncbi:hypothetical protein EON65_07820 [archaeon]|nr:MAG: hypothetical protein EON65_07820 [archaeon]